MMARARARRSSSASERTTGSSSSIARLSADNQDQRPGDGAMQQRVEQRLAGWGESGYTNPPRAALDLGYSTRKRERLLHVREEFANERKDHCLFSLPANRFHHGDTEETEKSFHHRGTESTEGTGIGSPQRHGDTETPKSWTMDLRGSLPIDLKNELIRAHSRKSAVALAFVFLRDLRDSVVISRLWSELQMQPQAGHGHRAADLVIAGIVDVLQIEGEESAAPDVGGVERLPRYSRGHRSSRHRPG